MSDIAKRFSEGARRVITASLLCAKELGHTYVGSEHLLLGLLRDGEGVSQKLLVEHGVTYEDIRRKIVGLVGMGCKSMLSSEDMTPVCRRIILRASILAGSGDLSTVGLEHLTMSLLREECVAVRLLRECGIDTDEIYTILEELYCDSELEENEDDVFPIANSRLSKQIATPLLDSVAVDLTEKARSGRVDPVIGRKKEEERLIAILLRRSKNNPVLIGEAGVGKTAIVESLANRIASGNVPEELKDKRIMSLELSTVVAGTKYRGEFEEKIKNILEEVRSAGDIILFLDELHTIVGAGGAEGAIDASNILKPSLARGEIRLIGATTVDEFRESIERDKALERRFQPITVAEPTVDECIEMLCGIKKKYEAYHGVTITDAAIKAAVTMSVRYLPDRFLPDKAIDLLDEASAILKMAKKGKGKFVLSENEVVSVVELRTGIPLNSLTQDESERVRTLEAELSKSVIGQDEAIKALSEAVRRARLGVREGGRPNGSFLFIGKAGVGKTECAKTLARVVFNSDKAFIRLDMSEFSEPHSVSKILGAPAGYVGFGEGNSLTERVKRNPYCLLLFDEIEKSHPDVRALLLQILDEGTLTDSTGVKVRFDNTIVIMTANSGSDSAGIGFSNEGTRSANASASKILSPELADRVDEIIMFKPLSESDLKSIAEIKLSQFCERIKARGLDVELAEDFVEQVLSASVGRSARSVSRTAIRLAEEGISQLLLSQNGDFPERATLFIENGRGSAKIKQNTY